MNEIKLKPCPFCGGKAEIWEVTTGKKPFEETNISVGCLQCFGRPFYTRIENLCYRRDNKEILEDMKQEVTEKWNRRANDETVEAGPVKYGIWIKSGGDKYPIYTCSKCTHYNCESTAYCPNCGVKMEGEYEY